MPDYVKIALLIFVLWVGLAGAVFALLCYCWRQRPLSTEEKWQLREKLHQALHDVNEELQYDYELRHPELRVQKLQRGARFRPKDSD